MKGIDAIISTVIIIAISITAIFLALNLGTPSTQKAKEILTMQEGSGNLIAIDNAVKSVLSEGEGSTRVLKFSIAGGNYKIDNFTNSILFSLESKSQIIAEGVSKTENDIIFSGMPGMVYLNLSYENIQVTGEGDFGRGYHTLTIRNNGYNTTTQKQMIYISLIAPTLPTVITFTDEYDQTQTTVLKGTSTSNKNNLNDFGINTYDITESIESENKNYFQSSTENITGFNTTLPDYTNSLDDDNYNVTSTVGDSGGMRVDKYNQSYSDVIFGTPSTNDQATINSYLNVNGDEITWDTAKAQESLSTISFDSASSMTQSTTASFITWSHTTGTNSNRLLLVAVSIHVATGTPTTVTSVTYGGVALTQVTTDLYSASTPRVRTYVFQLLNPASGTNTIRVNFAASTLSVAGAVTYSGVDQTTPIQTSSTVTGSGTLPSVSTTVSGSGRILFGHLGGHRTQNTWAITEGIGQNNRWSQVAQLYKGRGSDKTVSTGTQTMYWTLSRTANFVASAIVINPTSIYRAEVEHNATISYSGNLNSINVSVNLTSTVNDVYRITIYDFANSLWDVISCQSTSVTANNYYTIWCRVTSNPTNYNSSTGTVRIRINSSSNANMGTLKEEYVQYYVGYTKASSTAKIYVEHNASNIENPSLINEINVTSVLKTNATSGILFDFSIYNFNTKAWELCSQALISKTNYVKLECIKSSPLNYISDSKIRVRINSSGDFISHEMLEDYLVFQTTLKPSYIMEVDHNATGVSWLGSLDSINISLNFSTNSADAPTFNLFIYNFNSNDWDMPCSSIVPIANAWNMIWCNKTANPSYYNSTEGVIRVKLNETSHQNLAEVKEDFIQYHVTYTQ